MQKTSFRRWPCSVARTVDLIGDGWTLLLLREAFYGVRRFDDFAESLEISRNTLARKLRHLVDEGILDRVRYQDDPPRYEYRLTEKGRELFDVIVVLMRWGDTWTDERKKGPPVVLTDRASGRKLEPVVVDRRTGDRIDVRKVAVVAGPGMDVSRMTDAVARRFSVR